MHIRLQPILKLFLEVVTKYEVAGIQGDDHFPALPMEVDTPRSKDTGILNRIVVKTTARIISAVQVLP
ncbi:hypothetical protein MEN98_13685 [Dolichospermum sp. ST_sed8]|nr:hypothetical protein [Dolichospermum sp. ST_sed8]